MQRPCTSQPLKPRRTCQCHRVHVLHTLCAWSSTPHGARAGHFLYPLAESGSSEAGEQLRVRIEKLHADYQSHCWEADVQAYDAGFYSQV